MTIKQEMKFAVRRAIVHCRSTGTVAMSRDNLWQITQFKGTSVASGYLLTPRCARQAFEEVVNETPAFVRFTSLEKALENFS